MPPAAGLCPDPLFLAALGIADTPAQLGLTDNPIEWLQTADKKTKPTDSSEGRDRIVTHGGFLGISNRDTVKPIIAAVNGSSYGGGTEALVNCDLAVAVSSATISLPESRRGVIAIAGALPRIGRQLGLKRATELAVVSEPISAYTAHQWGLINKVVDNPDDLLPAAFDLAHKVSLGSPEAITASLRGIRRGYSDTKHSLVEATAIGAQNDGPLVNESENIKEGLRAFNEKRNPKWRL